MDELLARTLGELERKLEQLERTVSAIGTAEATVGATAPADASWGARRGRIIDETVESARPEPAVGGWGVNSGGAQPARWPSAEPATETGPAASVEPHAGAEPEASVSQIADIQPTSAVEQSFGAEQSFGVEQSFGAEQDSGVERDSTAERAFRGGRDSGAKHGAGEQARGTEPFTSAKPTWGGRRASNAEERESTARAPRLGVPSAEELLRFRERLERAVSDLTHDYDALLGRLSYPAVPSTSAPTISFARGAPSLDIIDIQGLTAAAARAFESDPAGTTAYGTSVGYPRLRAWIADRHDVEHERVLVTNGSMQADAFLFEHLVRPGDDVVVEGPSYDRTLLSLRQRGAWVHQIPLQPDGIDTEALAALLSGGAGAQPKLAHIIPNFQNPAGYTLSLAKRHTLLELAAKHSFMVFEDDPYVELRFSGERLPTMLSMDPERVVYASSFSKTVCPGIRVGYLVGPPDLIGAIAQLATNTYISPSMVAQAIAYEFCASGAIDRSIETARRALAERAQTLAHALSRELPEAQFVPPQGGYFMWVTLPEGTDVRELHHAAAARGVSIVKGTDFLLEGGENMLRLAFAGVTPSEIELGVDRLAEAYRSL